MSDAKNQKEVLGEALSAILDRYLFMKARGLTLDEIRYIGDGRGPDGLKNLLVRDTVNEPSTPG